ncbi:MAG: S-methyl-5-thioribose-1-phosphate isomerase [Chloroflexota bacterium]|nr:MAG: S-methyl-5-thioribose-1-phosphate isomerase [Chloroflexota bacterium]
MTATLEFRNGVLYLLDQTLLPLETVVIECREVAQVMEAIASLRVRGAPAIGCAGAYGGVVAAMRRADRGLRGDDLANATLRDFERIRQTRPTAVNLPWALGRMKTVVERHASEESDALIRALRDEADEILREDEEANRAIGRYGADLIANGAQVLTHCNAGALATGAYGTALGVIRAAHEQGRSLRVWVDETRPLLQGARLTAWELEQMGVPYTLITDSMAGHFMARGEVDVALVGADRIAANGDTANKIGTYSVAVLARAHGIPFYVAAPTSTIDLETANGESVPIEERRADEVGAFGSVRVAPAGARVANPAFDVTPARLITGIITERGVLRPPFAAALAGAVNAERVDRGSSDSERRPDAVGVEPG